MANQSNLQQLLQNLAGTHTAAQANVPSSVNNGNPNTIYNLPQNPPPATAQPWLAPVPPQPINWQGMIQPTNKYQLPTLPPFVPNTNNGGGWTGIPTTPPVTTPPDPSKGGPDTHIPGGETGGGTGTGGNLPPSGGGPNGGNHNENGNGNGTGNEGRGQDWMDFGGDRTFGDNLRNSFSGNTGNSNGTGSSPINGGQLLNMDQNGNILTNGSSFLGHLLDGIQQKLGMDSSGGMSWQQAIDLVVPGNAYLSGSQKWDLSNVLASLAGSFTGLPINQMMNQFGKYLAQNQDSWIAKLLPEWLKNVFVDHARDNAQNHRDQLNPHGRDGGGANQSGGTGGGFIGGSYGSGFDPLAGQGTDWMQMDQNGNPIDLYNIDETGTPRDGWWTGGNSNDPNAAAGTLPNNFNRLRDSRGTGRGFSH